MYIIYSFNSSRILSDSTSWCYQKTCSYKKLKLTYKNCISSLLSKEIFSFSGVRNGMYGNPKQMVKSSQKRVTGYLYENQITRLYLFTHLPNIKSGPKWGILDHVFIFQKPKRVIFKINTKKGLDYSISLILLLFSDLNY